MTDIVEKLRKLSTPARRKYGVPADVAMDEAADEITRLRNELHIAQEWSARVIAGHEQDMTEITALRAENERLKAALREYECHCHPPVCEWFPCGKTARNALEEKQ